MAGNNWVIAARGREEAYLIKYTKVFLSLVKKLKQMEFIFSFFGNY